MKTLVAQRVFGLALGYEDLVDHDELRRDPVLGVLLGKFERGAEAPALLAGKSTLNRLELAPADGATGRYHKIGHDGAAIEALFVDVFLDAHAKPPREIVLDLDATDDPLHGHQEVRFFHGYYDCYCYLPLYVFCGDLKCSFADTGNPFDFIGMAAVVVILIMVITSIAILLSTSRALKSYMRPVRLTGRELLDVRAVRGPATRDAAGLPTETPLGDPGLLAPMLLKGRPKVDARWGLIPHLVDRRSLAIRQMVERMRHMQIIDLANPDVAQVTREIASCEAVLSSSLHGLIVADALGVPNARLKLSDLVAGGDWK